MKLFRVGADDPRLSGVGVFTWSGRSYNAPMAGPSSGVLNSHRVRIENNQGAWEGTMTGMRIGSDCSSSAGWLVGELWCDGLMAYVVLRSNIDFPDEMFAFITAVGPPGLPVRFEDPADG